MSGTPKPLRRYLPVGAACRYVSTAALLLSQSDATRPAPGRLAAKATVCCNNKERALKLKFITAIAVAMALSLGSIGAIRAAAPQTETGIASVYSYEAGSITASGEKLNAEALTAAHKTLPFGTKVRVTNKNNGLVVVVTINDRGPFIRGRIIDLTPAGARALGFNGLAPVVVEVLT
jgi:rare lipoprotein A